MKLGPQTHFGARSLSAGTMQLVPKPRKVAIIIPRRRRGTWEGVTVATWCSEWICRTWGGLGPHSLIIPALLSLPPMRGAAIGREPKILQNDSFYTRISNFVKSPILSATSLVVVTSNLSDQWRHPPSTPQHFTHTSESHPTRPYHLIPAPYHLSLKSLDPTSHPCSSCRIRVCLVESRTFTTTFPSQGTVDRERKP